MRSILIKAAFAAALPIFLAAPAMADETHDKLLKACQENEADPSSCECRVKALEDNMDPKVLKVLVATMDASTAASPEEAEKAGKAALDEAGMTQEDFQKAMEAAMPKVEEAMKACDKPQ